MDAVFHEDNMSWNDDTSSIPAGPSHLSSISANSESEDEGEFWDIPSDARTEGERYVESIKKPSGLQILQSRRVRAAYAERKEAGLFQPFLSLNMINNIKNWANTSSKLGKQITEIEMHAYAGLEMAMSLIRLNKIKDYWSKKMFQGHKDFTQTMSRDRFLKIMSCVRFY